MAIKLEMLRVFRAVVDQGSLAAAAEVLGRTPSAVSMTLKQFEDHIGAPLFESGRKARLTALGTSVHSAAKRELEHYDRTLDMIEALSQAEMGLVRLAATPSVAMAVLPPVLRAFLAEHPRVRIELRDMNSIGVQQAMEQEQADIGLATVPVMPGLERRPFMQDRFGVVCRADHPLAQNWDSLTWDDLTDVDLITNDLCALIRDPSFAPLRARARMHVPNTASLVALVREGIGITILPRLVARTNLRDLAFLPLRDMSERREVSIITPPREEMIPAARALAERIEAARPAPEDQKI